MLKMMETILVGAVEYTISDTEKDVITARYLSSGSMAAKPGVICRGRAVGDTSNGFPGKYVIRYFDVDDKLAGEFDWQIESVGPSFRLTWRARPGPSLMPGKPGDIMFEGFGFPNTPRSIVVCYWIPEDISKAMAARMAGQQAKAS